MHSKCCKTEYSAIRHYCRWVKCKSTKIILLLDQASYWDLYLECLSTHYKQTWIFKEHLIVVFRQIPASCISTSQLLIMKWDFISLWIVCLNCHQVHSFDNLIEICCKDSTTYCITLWTGHHCNAHFHEKLHESYMVELGNWLQCIHWRFLEGNKFIFP